jgi:hypothetical protein
MGAGSNAASAGISMGSALAMIISYGKGNHLLLVIVHGILSWLYVIWHVIQ